MKEFLICITVSVGILYGAYYSITKELCTHYSSYTQKELDNMKLTKKECE